MEDMKAVLLAGCKHNQYSFDATIEGTPHGAFTFHAIKAIREASYSITYRDLRETVVTALSDSNFDQEPQAEGSDANLDRQIFT